MLERRRPAYLLFLIFPQSFVYSLGFKPTLAYLEVCGLVSGIISVGHVYLTVLSFGGHLYRYGRSYDTLGTREGTQKVSYRA
jgi:hypothetical protein